MSSKYLKIIMEEVSFSSISDSLTPVSTDKVMSKDILSQFSSGKNTHFLQYLLKTNFKRSPLPFLTFIQEHHESLLSKKLTKFNYFTLNFSSKHFNPAFARFLEKSVTVPGQKFRGTAGCSWLSKKYIKSDLEFNFFIY